MPYKGAASWLSSSFRMRGGGGGGVRYSWEFLVGVYPFSDLASTQKLCHRYLD